MYRNSFRLTNKEIDEAFATRQFRLVFQPKIDLANGALVGVESFARWQHPQFGVIPPALFLPVLARQGRNQELTRFVLTEAIAQLGRWRAGEENRTVSINVAPEELADGSLPVSIRLALNAADLDPGCLIIDLPERGLAAEPEHAVELVETLDAEFAKHDIEEWGRRLDAEDVVWAPVQTMAQVAEDKQAEAAGVFVDIPDGAGGTGRSVASPVRLPNEDGTTADRVRGPAPGIGEHTADILKELGYDDAGLEDLKAAGAIN